MGGDIDPQGVGPGGIPDVGDPLRFSTIAHARRTILGPFEPVELDAFLDDIDLRPGDRALDIGCGKGDLLVRLATRGATGIGVDRNPWFLAEGRRLAERAGQADRVQFVLGDASELAANDPAVGLARPFDVVTCVGATGAIGGPEAAPRRLAGRTRPGGIVVIGEGYWRRPPEDAWLPAFGIEPGEMLDREGCLSRVRAPGLAVLTARDASMSGWDAYEDAYAGAIEAWAALHSDDPERDEFLARAAMFRSTFADWRREAMGFLLVALRA